MSKKSYAMPLIASPARGTPPSSGRARIPSIPACVFQHPNVHPTRPLCARDPAPLWLSSAQAAQLRLSSPQARLSFGLVLL
ncbi:uncharacterized protein BDZ99DRAFT_468201, partial [Mytilinidion resinicola]